MLQGDTATQRFLLDNNDDNGAGKKRSKQESNFYERFCSKSLSMAANSSAETGLLWR